MAEEPKADIRAYARQLAARSLRVGDPMGWFEELYQAAEAGTAMVPWADLAPNPRLLAWAAARCPSPDGPGAGSRPARALVIGCGLGDDAEYLAGLGFATVAFDVAPSAVRAARRRFPQSAVRYAVGDVTAPDPAWTAAFDLVLEIYTVQVLQGPARAECINRISRFVAPSGTLVVIARARDDDEDAGRMPWPLTRSEIDGFQSAKRHDGQTLRLVHLADVADAEQPPVRRWVAEFQAPPSATRPG